MNIGRIRFYVTGGPSFSCWSLLILDLVVLELLRTGLALSPAQREPRSSFPFGWRAYLPGLRYAQFAHLTIRRCTRAIRLARSMHSNSSAPVQCSPRGRVGHATLVTFLVPFTYLFSLWVLGRGFWCSKSSTRRAHRVSDRLHAGDRWSRWANCILRACKFQPVSRSWLERIFFGVFFRVLGGLSPARGVLDSRVSLHGVQGRGMRATVSSCPPNSDTVEDLAFDLIRRDWAFFGDLLALFLSICTSKCFTIACIHLFDCLPFFLGAHIAWVARARGRCVRVDLIFFTLVQSFGAHIVLFRVSEVFHGLAESSLSPSFLIPDGNSVRPSPSFSVLHASPSSGRAIIIPSLHSHLSIVFPISLCPTKAHSRALHFVIHPFTRRVSPQDPVLTRD
ncbi:hypothetical protein FA13DRAFT_1466561 [Coprinellus micaceus]|uniref:Uncharacterized protein n=1 Tax=Coprinellus micaceus TaxID=71717 RepID=A0A4Y7SM50_COPMI|nr:hypothetical protein FA13DRAFT_1466561 [Coprinellus micaceus]